MGTNVACIIYYMLFFDREEQEFSWSLKDFTLSADVLKPVLWVGSSQMVSSLFLVVSALVLNNLAVKYGDAAVASFGVSDPPDHGSANSVYGYLHGQYSTFCIYLRCGESGRLRAALKVRFCSQSEPRRYSRFRSGRSTTGRCICGRIASTRRGPGTHPLCFCSTVFYALVMLLVAWFQAYGKGVSGGSFDRERGRFLFITVFAGDTLWIYRAHLAFPVTQKWGRARSGVALFWRAGARVSGSVKSVNTEISRRATSLTRRLCYFHHVSALPTGTVRLCRLAGR